MGREEQVEEREVLDSIFPDEITDIAEDEFRIVINLDLPDEAAKAAKATETDDDVDDSEPYSPSLLLTVHYPEDYPNMEPRLDLTAPEGGTQHPLLNVAEDKDQLLAGLRETIQESLGMAMVFTIVSALKDAAEQLIVSRHDAAVHAQEEALLAAEREENQKFHGTSVTPESFVRWRDSFVKEMAEQRRREEEERLAEQAKRRGGSGGGPGSKDGVRLTGRQLWERGLAGKVDDEADEDEGGEGDVPEGVRNLKIEA